MSMTYLLQSSLCMVLFFSVYYFFLRNNSFFGLQRAYLLFTLLLSVTIPLIEIDWIAISEDSIVYNLSDSMAFQDFDSSQPNGQASGKKLSLIASIYLAGVVFMIAKALVGILNVLRIIRNSEIVYSEYGDKLITSDHNLPTSSFFKYIFLDPAAQEDLTLKQCVLVHERKHISDKHFFDLIALEIVRIFLWFNPVVYLYSNAIRNVHEFICDREVLRYTSRECYEESLIKALFKKSHIPLISSFSKISIKTRLNMINMKNSSNLEKLRFVIIIPLTMMVLIAFNPVQANFVSDSEGAEKIYGSVTSEDGKPLPGVKIMVDGKEVGATDLIGNYEVSLSEGGRIVKFVFTGFKSFKTKIPKNEELNVVMEKGKSGEDGISEALYVPEVKVITKSGNSYLAGVVKDKNGNPLSDINVLVPKQKIKTVTDKNGQFELELKSDKGIAIYGVPDENQVYRKIVSLHFGN